MRDFKGRRFLTAVILVCVRWYRKFGINYRNLGPSDTVVALGVEIKNDARARPEC